MKKKTPKRRSCRPSFKISHAGHLLVTKGNKRAASVLASDGKKEKSKRKKRGCLHGTSGGTFKLTAKQKKNLPIALQRAIIAHHRRRGKKIIS